MMLAISNIAWAPQERAEAYGLMAAAGVNGLEIAPGLFFHAAEDSFAPDAATARQAMTEIEAAGLRLVSMQSLLFGVQGAALFEGAAARARLERGLERAIDLAGRFGIPNLVFGSPAQRRVPFGMAMQTALEQAAELFRRLGERAAQAGTVIAIEANPRAYGTNFLNTLDEAADFVARVDHPQVALILDLGAMHMNGQFELTAARMPHLLPRLNHVHVSEPHLAPAPADPGQSAQVLAALRAAGYGRAVSIEMQRPRAGLSAVGASLAALCASARSGDPA